MSQYLTNFYCGNKRGHCNYNQPIPYEKLLNRNFDSHLHKILEDCQGKEFEKGYCCDPNNPELHKPVDDEFMEEMNQKFEARIFHKNEHGDFFPGQIPLIKPRTKNNKLDAIEVCTCGGTSEEYTQCVNENCKGFDYPTRYQYCKLGPTLDKVNCIVRNEESNSSEKSNKDLQKRCKLEPVNQETQYTYSHNFKVNNLFPDCYINLCNKNPSMHLLDELMSSSTTDEHKYHRLGGDSLRSYKFLKNEKELENQYQVSTNPKSSLFGLFQNSWKYAGICLLSGLNKLPIFIEDP